MYELQHMFQRDVIDLAFSRYLEQYIFNRQQLRTDVIKCPAIANASSLAVIPHIPKNQN